MDSLQASRINGGNSAVGRRTSDLYPTPPEVTVALMEFLNLPDRTMIWEPADRAGAMREEKGENDKRMFHVQTRI